MNEPQRLEDLGRRVIARRAEIGLPTTKSLAERMKVSPRLLGDIENGRRKVGHSSYARLEQALRWAPDSVRQFLEEGDPPDAIDVDDDRSATVDYVARFLAEGERTLMQNAGSEPQKVSELAVDFLLAARSAADYIEEAARVGVSYGTVAKLSEAMLAALMESGSWSIVARLPDSAVDRLRDAGVEPQQLIGRYAQAVRDASAPKGAQAASSFDFRIQQEKAGEEHDRSAPTKDAGGPGDNVTTGPFGSGSRRDQMIEDSTTEVEAARGPGEGGMRNRSTIHGGAVSGAEPDDENQDRGDDDWSGA